MRKVFICIVLAMLCVGCSDRKNISPVPSIDQDTKDVLSKPVNCDTAKEDILLLEAERASTAERMLSGVRMIMPIAAAAGILLGDYGDRVEVTTGQYNYDLEQKIDQISRSCHIGGQ